jgi:hypothetical protein
MGFRSGLDEVRSAWYEERVEIEVALKYIKMVGPGM